MPFIKTSNPNEENPWSQVSGGDGAYASVINFGTSYILSSQRGFTLIKDWNNPFNWNYGGGDKYSNYSWAYLYPPDFDRENEALFISPVYSNPSNDHILYYAGGNNLYRKVSDSDFMTDEGGGRSPENQIFIMNAVDYLIGDRDLIALRSREITSRPLEEVADDAKKRWKWLNIILPSFLIVGFGLIRMRQQKNRSSLLEEFYG